MARQATQGRASSQRSTAVDMSEATTAVIAARADTQHTTEDVEMHDVEFCPAPSREVDSPATRTSGRARRSSKKIEEAKIDVPNAEIMATPSREVDSPAPRTSGRTRKVSQKLVDADVGMRDAETAATPSREVDSPGPRASGRTRKISKKLEEAQADTNVKARDSIAQGSRSPEKEATPLVTTKQTPKSTKAKGTNGRTKGTSVVHPSTDEVPMKMSMTLESDLPPGENGHVLPASASITTSARKRKRTSTVKSMTEEAPTGASVPAERELIVEEGHEAPMSDVQKGHEAPVPDRIVSKVKGRSRKSIAAKVKPVTEEIPDSEPEDMQRKTQPRKSSLHVNGTQDAREPESAHSTTLGIPPASTHEEISTSRIATQKSVKTSTDPTIARHKDIQMADPPSVSAAAVELDYAFVFTREDLESLCHSVQHKLTRDRTTRLVDLDKEIAKVASVVEQTVAAGESNSMVIIGARGSGKSTLVHNTTEEQRYIHGDTFHVVKLNGFIHTDDKIAIREIWRQLGREMDLEDNNSVKNYADTMTTLLALLSHPSELGQTGTDVISKSIVIIIDEFDLFTTHPRQTLLYNLFDIAQSRKAPIAVLGLTTRFDVTEALEKRVKSRFSHRQVHLPLAKTFASFKNMCLSSMLVETTTRARVTSVDTWNKTMLALFETSTELNMALQSIYYTTKSVPSFQRDMLCPMLSLHICDRHTPASIIKHISTQLQLAPRLVPPDSSLTQLQCLSTLELALLISAARLVIIHSTENISFALAYDEYKSLASKARIAASASGALATGVGRVWGQTVARAAWDGLLSKGLVLSGLERGDVYRVDVSLEELGGCIDAGMDVGGMARWCKEI